MEKKPNGYWTIENCLEDALKYETRTEWQKNSGGAYDAARKNKWLDQCGLHMKLIGSKFKRLVYSFEFSDKSVYIGLTYNSNKRKNEHLNPKRIKKSSVYKYMNESGLEPEFKELTNYLSYDVAAKKEGEFLEKYSNDGWKILNKIKTGGLGGNITKWDKKSCKNVAIKFQTRKEFRKKHSDAYMAAHRYGWLNEICAHMNYLQKPNGFWSLEKLKEEGLKYNTTKEFQKKSNTAYSVAQKRGFLNIICNHMEKCRKDDNYWNFEKCRDEAAKYTTIKEWRNNSTTSYSIAIKNKWKNKIVSHMIFKTKPRNYWNFENCKLEALKYDSRKIFGLESNGAYEASRKNGWLNQICNHMK